MEASFDAIFQRFERVACHVKCTMARDFERSRFLNQLTATFYVDSALRSDDSKDESVYAKPLKLADIPFHSMKFKT
jgi:hypothetical protein